MRNHGEWRFYSPLRYPGGKGDLANFVKLLLVTNRLSDIRYVEPYAGGASVALHLLFEEYAARVHINDIDVAVHSFWRSVLDQTERFREAVQLVPLTMAEWRRQRAIYDDPDAEQFDLGFATFFLNRTNRSGILSAGPIGGKNQGGEWKLDARFNRKGLAERIAKVGRFRGRIELTNMDAEAFISGIADELPASALLYLDPPYIEKGSKLYENAYAMEDHERLAGAVRRLQQPWMVSYDYHPRLLELYGDHRCMVYSLSYHAQESYRGQEIIFFSDNLTLPVIDGPAKIKGKDLTAYIRQHYAVTAAASVHREAPVPRP